MAEQALVAAQATPPGPRVPAATVDQVDGGGSTDPLSISDVTGGISRSNVISRTVDELTRLLTEIDDAREELIARGIQNQTLNVLVELGFHGREEGRETLFESALAGAREAHGVGAISREELTRRLDALVMLERDVAHARRMARQQGLDLQVLNFLTQLIRKNPGDGGERAIDTFFGYALACGKPLAGIADVAQRVGGAPKSVLPDIERHPRENGRQALLQVVRDVTFGLIAGVGMIWLLV